MSNGFTVKEQNKTKLTAKALSDVPLFHTTRIPISGERAGTDHKEVG